MFYPAWQNPPPGADVSVHLNDNPNAVEDGSSEDFAVVSIATDMAGYRSRIFVAYFRDGMKWERGECVSSKGQDTTGSGLDPVHAEAISFNVLDDGCYRIVLRCLRRERELVHRQHRFD